MKNNILYKNLLPKIGFFIYKLKKNKIKVYTSDLKRFCDCELDITNQKKLKILDSQPCPNHKIKICSKHINYFGIQSTSEYLKSKNTNFSMNDCAFCEFWKMNNYDKKIGVELINFILNPFKEKNLKMISAREKKKAKKKEETEKESVISRKTKMEKEEDNKTIQIIKSSKIEKEEGEPIQIFDLFQNLIKEHPDLKVIPPSLFFQNKENGVLKFLMMNYQKAITLIISKRKEYFDMEYAIRNITNLTKENYLKYYDKLNDKIKNEYIKTYEPVYSPPDGIEIKEIKYESKTEPELGVFSSKFLVSEKDLGYFSGLIIESMESPHKGKNTQDYLAEFYLKEELLGIPIIFGKISIDPTRDLSNSDKFTWSSRINHKWNYKNIATNTGLTLPNEWNHLFSNIEMSPTFQISLLRDIKKGEELNWDYGLFYWNENNKPIWDLKESPESFLSFLISGKSHVDWEFQMQALKEEMDKTKDETKKKEIFFLISSFEERKNTLKKNFYIYLKKSNVLGHKDKINQIYSISLPENPIMFIKSKTFLKSPFNNNNNNNNNNNKIIQNFEISDFILINDDAGNTGSRSVAKIYKRKLDETHWMVKKKIFTEGYFGSIFKFVLGDYTPEPAFFWNGSSFFGSGTKIEPTYFGSGSFHTGKKVFLKGDKKQENWMFTVTQTSNPLFHDSGLALIVISSYIFGEADLGGLGGGLQSNLGIIGMYYNSKFNDYLNIEGKKPLYFKIDHDQNIFLIKGMQMKSYDPLKKIETFDDLLMWKYLKHIALTTNVVIPYEKKVNDKFLKKEEIIAIDESFLEEFLKAQEIIKKKITSLEFHNLIDKLEIILEKIDPNYPENPKGVLKPLGDVLKNGKAHRLLNKDFERIGPAILFRIENLYKNFK